MLAGALSELSSHLTNVSSAAAVAAADGVTLEELDAAAISAAVSSAQKLSQVLAFPLKRFATLVCHVV